VLAQMNITQFMNEKQKHFW